MKFFMKTESRAVTVDSDEGEVTLTDVNRVTVYDAEFEWNAKDLI